MATTTSSTLSRDEDDLAEEARTAVQRLRDQADAVIQRIQPQISAVSTFARDEPTKAMLIAAATGAGLMALVSLLARGDSRPTAPARSAMSSIRDAALSLADRAHNAASGALDTLHSRATGAIDTAHQRGNDAARDTDRLSDTMTSAWQSVRDRAEPLVDRVRPQLDAAASYARDEPAKTALGAAVVGAVLVGLLALARSSSEDD